ncbi:MAG: hypothetical protein HY712_00405 [candidate division NC10 bacterium]|nr:hypothetical protein [candidate division NC10 bacterium]
MNWKIGIRGKHELWAVTEVRVSTAGFCLSLVWEFLQSPLYADAFEAPWGQLVYNRVHCSVGDVLILLASYWAVAAIRGRNWIERPGWPATVAFAALGLTYTVFSEYFRAADMGAEVYATRGAS